MKKSYSFLLLMLVAFAANRLHAQAFCNPGGDIAIFSNYDGGILRIDVDTNIANLKIGIVSYEDDSVIISGTYAANVTQVVYAGYYNSSNVHCATNINVKGVYGVSPSIVTINAVPAATYSNPNGYSSIICNYSCSSTTNQGGCNTPDQVADYFFNQFGSTSLLFHYTQYGCWSGTYAISGGGNCCIVPPTTGLASAAVKKEGRFFPNPAGRELNVKFNARNTLHKIELYNLLGEKVRSLSFAADAEKGKMDLGLLPAGIYFAVLKEGEEKFMEKVLVE